MLSCGSYQREPCLVDTAPSGPDLTAPCLNGPAAFQRRLASRPPAPPARAAAPTHRKESSRVLLVLKERDPTPTEDEISGSWDEKGLKMRELLYSFRGCK